MDVTRLERSTAAAAAAEEGVRRAPHARTEREERVAACARGAAEHRAAKRPVRKWPIKWRRGATLTPTVEPEANAVVSRKRSWPVIEEKDPVRIPNGASGGAAAAKKKGPVKRARTAGASGQNRSNVQIKVLEKLWDGMVAAGVKPAEIPHMTRVIKEGKSSEHALSFQEFITGYERHLERVTELDLSGIDLSNFKDNDFITLWTHLPKLKALSLENCRLTSFPRGLFALATSGCEVCIGGNRIKLPQTTRSWSGGGVKIIEFSSPDLDWDEIDRLL